MDLEELSNGVFVFLNSACLAGWAEGVKGSSVEEYHLGIWG